MKSVDAKALRFAAGIGLAYAFAGVCWIYFSDELVGSLSRGPAWQLAAQHYKGMFYVLVTALGLTLLIRAGYSRLLRALDEAQSSELRVHDMFLRHPKPMWVFERETLKFVSVNEAAIQHYGYTGAEFLGMTLKDIRPPEEVTKLPGEVTGGAGAHCDIGITRHAKKSGEVIHVRMTVHPIPYQGGLAMLAMADDITAELLSKRALERQEAQFRQLHDSLAEVLWLASADGKEMLYVSPAFERLYGFSPEEFRRNPQLWFEAIHPEDRGIAAASHEALQREGRASCEYRLLLADGTVRWMSDRKRVIVDEEGLVQMIGGIGEDISEAKARVAEGVQTQAKLEQMVAERTVELERVNAELDAFTRTAAHDLKSPLNGILGFAQILRMRYEPKLDADFSRMTRHIEQSATHMAHLVNDLLALSQVTITDLSRVEVDVAALAREVLDGLRLLEPGRSVEFHAPESVIVEADPGLMRALLSNLLGNAWKFTGKRAQAVIRMTADTALSGTSLSITDNGVGFDATRRDRLFKPFERFHSLSEFSGTGVGLTTCQRIVNRHGGSIEVDSTPGEGTTVRLLFPMFDPAINKHGAASVTLH